MAGMSTVTRTTGDRPARTGAGPAPSPVVAGLLAAAQAAAASLVVVLVPTVLAWATASYSRAPWGQAVRFGVDAWLLAHHTGIAIPGGHVGLTPLGVMLVPLITCWIAGIRLARHVDPHLEAIAHGVGRHRPAWPPPRALIALVVGYATLVTLAGALVTAPGARPLVAQAFAGATVVCAPAALAGAGTWRAGGRRAGAGVAIRLLRLPEPVHRCLGPAAWASAGLLAGGLVLFAVAAVLGRGQIADLHAALHPGLAGGVVLVLAQITVVPNAAVWAGAFAAGPGFAVGTGSSVTASATQLGAVPAVPILGALPAPGERPAWLWLVVLLPVAAGALAGRRLLRRADAPPRELLTDVGGTALLSGLAWAVLAWLSAGPAGPGRLADVGPVAWSTGLLVAAEVAVGALLAVGAGLGARRFKAWEAGQEPEQ
jgi:uncharacterized protein DUF6350